MLNFNLRKFLLCASLATACLSSFSSTFAYQDLNVDNSTGKKYYPDTYNNQDESVGFGVELKAIMKAHDQFSDVDLYGIRALAKMQVTDSINVGLIYTYGSGEFKSISITEVDKDSHRIVQLGTGNTDLFQHQGGAIFDVSYDDSFHLWAEAHYRMFSLDLDVVHPDQEKSRVKTSLKGSSIIGTVGGEYSLKFDQDKLNLTPSIEVTYMKSFTSDKLDTVKITESSSSRIAEKDMVLNDPKMYSKAVQSQASNYIEQLPYTKLNGRFKLSLNYINATESGVFGFVDFNPSIKKLSPGVGGVFGFNTNDFVGKIDYELLFNDKFSLDKMTHTVGFVAGFKAKSFYVNVSYRMSFENLNLSSHRDEAEFVVGFTL